MATTARTTATMRATATMSMALREFMNWIIEALTLMPLLGRPASL